MSAPTAGTRPGTETRLDRVPTPRTPLSEPAQRAAGLGRRGQVAVVGIAMAGLVATSVLVAERASALTEHRAAVSRVAQASSAQQVDADSLSAATSSLAAGAASGQRSALAAGSATAVADATAVAAASPHAGDALTALAAAVAGVQRTAGSVGYAPLALRSALGALGAARGQVVAGESTWQAAEQARIAGEQAAAAAAAAAASAPRTPTITRRTTGSTQSAPAPAPAAGTSGTVHAVTLACVTPAPGSGSGANASAVGAAINSYRASNGLPTLAVSVSGALSTHALNMAASGGIWHSGFDNIVGCAPGVGSLVSAWSHSPSHNAQMLRTDVSSMSVGAATSAGYLFSAVTFN